MNGGASHEDLLGFEASPPHPSEGSLGSADAAAVQTQAFSIDLLGFDDQVAFATNGESHPSVKDPIDVFGPGNETVEDLILKDAELHDDPFSNFDPPSLESIGMPEQQQGLTLLDVAAAPEAEALTTEPVANETDSRDKPLTASDDVVRDEPISDFDPPTLESIGIQEQQQGLTLLDIVAAPEAEAFITEPVANETDLQDEPLPASDDVVRDEPISDFDPPTLGSIGMPEQQQAGALLDVTSASEAEAFTTKPVANETDSRDEPLPASDDVLRDDPISDFGPPTLDSIGMTEQQQGLTLLDVAAAPEAEAFITEPVANETDLQDEPLPASDDVVRDEPISDFGPPTLGSIGMPEQQQAGALLDVTSASEAEAFTTEPVANETDLRDEPLSGSNDGVYDEPVSDFGPPTLDSIGMPEQQQAGTLLDVTSASEAEAFTTEPVANETPLHDEPVPASDAELYDVPPSDFDPSTTAAELRSKPLSDPDISAEVAASPESADAGRRTEDALSVEMPVLDATPSWATPDAIADTAPTWASVATAAAAPKSVKSLPTESTAFESAIQEHHEPDPATEALIIELQASLQGHLSEREAATERARKADERAQLAELRVQELEAVVQAKFILEKELHATKSSLSSAMADRENLLKELDKLREDRDDHERKQIVLSNRLNAAKKQEAAKANLAETLEDSVKVLKYDFEKTQVALKEVTAAKEKLAVELKTSSEDYEHRIKKLDILLGEERRLNEERKKKMKAFVENKQEEVREAKSQNDELNMELSQTNRSLREHHARWKQLHAQWVQSQTRNRELQRDINRMKMESENMSRMGDQMNVKLSQRAQETETHKSKRLTAKQELMTVLETLEAEREVTSKLQDSIKFTFTPKALSQQQILKENLRDFEHELIRLSQRLGKPLPPSHDTPAETFALQNDDEEAESEGGTTGRRSRSQVDAAHLLSNLEDETQRVSQCIMAMTANVERLHVLIAQSGERTCATLLSDLLAGTTAAQTEEGSGDMAGPRLGLGTNRRYGQVPTGND